MGLQDAAQVGDFIGGLATAVGVAVAGYGVLQWRHVKRRERESEVAGRALAAFATTCEALALWARRISFAARGECTELDDLTKPFRGGKELVEAGLPEFRAANALARIYLSAALTEPLAAASQIVRDIEKEFREYLDPMAFEGAPSEARLAPMVPFFDEYADEIGKLAERGAQLLGPKARLE